MNIQLETPYDKKMKNMSSRVSSEADSSGLCRESSCLQLQRCVVLLDTGSILGQGKNYKFLILPRGKYNMVRFNI